MNNGKVRIYELSRELNLENKDILAVCDQLNIAVKSHSSTITEDEAERIRSSAEKYVASHPEARASGPAKPKGNLQSPESVGRDRTRKKQQILEIRQNPRPSYPEPRAASEAGIAKESPQTPPAPVTTPRHTPVSQHGSTPMKPTILNRPVRSSSDYDPDNAAPDLEEEPLLAQEVFDSEESTYSTVEEAEEPIAVKTPAEQPRLVSPPLRPAASEPNSPQGTTTDRPVLKRAKTDAPRPQAERPSAPAKAGSGQPPPTQGDRKQPAVAPQPAAGVSDKVGTRPKTARPAGAPSPQRPGAPRPQAVPELLAPPQPRAKVKLGDRVASRSGGIDGDTDTAGDLANDGTESEELLLDRPVPPRPPKRLKKVGKNEEEEIQEFPDKAGKAGAKAKRRVKPLADEDDDDLDSDLDELPAASLVSLSIARPAKPKAPPSQRASVTGAPTAAGKIKKSGSSREAAARNRARRQELKSVKKERPEKLVLTGSMTVRELADALAIAETEIVKVLFFKGMAVNITQTLDLPTATLVAQELGVEVETGEAESEARKVTEMLDATDLENLKRRPPVVTIMGHVDHGKTTLLDAIRQTKVAQGEAGGITQHIGAYHVDVEHEGEMQQVVFLDTPGHEAFTAMRARGARVTDIAILVVAADDGVQPQTIEAISHAKAAEVPIVVAINKIDKEGAQADRVKQQLTEYALVAEDWGGDTIMVPVSAMRGENLDTLLEMILLVAEIEELSANPDRAAKGTVIEAHLDKAKGPVATLLVQNGTLRVGDVFVAGSAFGKVRAMVDDRGQRVEAASPSFAVEVLGLRDVPAAGDDFEVFLNEKEGAAIAELKAEQNRQSRLQQAMASRRVTLNSLSQQAKEGQLKELNLILKADVQGSLEAILGALKQLPQNEVQVRVLFSAPGEITETDVDLAAASDAVIIGFNTTLATGARQASDRAGVDVREYNIIYKLLDDITGAMEGLLDPEMVEEPLGQVEVRAIFPASKGSVAGCYVQSGKVIRNCKVRVRRSGNVLHEGVIDSLKRMKEDAKEVNAGYECGIGLANFHDWAEGDIIEAFRMVSKRRTLSPI